MSRIARSTVALDIEAGVPWPQLTSEGPGHDIDIDGVSLVALVKTYGTPLQVVSESEIRARARAYKASFPEFDIAYAGKAFLCSTMADWMMQEGLLLDVCSGGELALAIVAGVPAGRILMHGDAKTPAELAAAHRLAVGRIVLDSFTEISQLVALGHSADGNARQSVLVRVLPGVDGHTHRSIDTGREDQQFGFSLSSGAAFEAVRRVVKQPELNLTGLHCHIGSQVSDISAYQEAARRMVGLMALVRDTTGLILRELDLGGGHAVAYRAGDPQLSPEQLGGPLRAALTDACRAHELPMPRIILEPGLAIVARSGVTVYRVITVKTSATGAVFVAVDGGMSDNPRPSLYDAQYTARLFGRAFSPSMITATIVGRHCESGDVLVRNTPLPADVRPGDLLVMLSTGAYQHSMASNYNMVCRSPVVSVRRGAARLLIRRETMFDLMGRDTGVPRLVDASSS